MWHLADVDTKVNLLSQDLTSHRVLYPAHLCPQWKLTGDVSHFKAFRYNDLCRSSASQERMLERCTILQSEYAPCAEVGKKKGRSGTESFCFYFGRFLGSVHYISRPLQAWAGALPLAENDKPNPFSVLLIFHLTCLSRILRHAFCIDSTDSFRFRGYFIDQDLLNRLNIPPQPLPHPCKVQAIDGGPTGEGIKSSLHKAPSSSGWMQ